MTATAHVTTRTALQRVATHVLARRRHDVSGRFGLRAAPGGIATPAFGDGPEVVRVSGTTLVHERGGDATVHGLEGASLRSLAAAVGVDLDAPFDVGHDTPAVGDIDEPLALDAGALDAIAGWFALGARALDAAIAALGPGAAAATVQLWPEHFDLGTSVAVGGGTDDRCNLGASAGDGYHEDPYLYVGPWGSTRPGPDDGYWNAPFGAVLSSSSVLAADDPLAMAAAFLLDGVARLRAT